MTEVLSGAVRNGAVGARGLLFHNGLIAQVADLDARVAVGHRLVKFHQAEHVIYDINIVLIIYIHPSAPRLFAAAERPQALPASRRPRLLPPPRLLSLGAIIAELGEFGNKNSGRTRDFPKDLPRRPFPRPFPRKTARSLCATAVQNFLNSILLFSYILRALSCTSGKLMIFL